MARGSNRGLNIDWTLTSHVGQIDNRGETLIHEVGLRCTCNNEDTDAGAILRKDVPRRRTILTCERCDGSGYIYRNPQKIVALVTGIVEDFNRQEAGWAVRGDAIMSPKPGYRVTTGDLITFTWAQPLDEGQVVVRGAANMSDNTTRKIGLEDNEDRLWYHAVESLWCEDSDGKAYRGGSDFILDGSKIIRWQGNAPLKGQAYTIKYIAYMEWEAWMPPMVRRDRDRDLGGRVALRKRHVATTMEQVGASPMDKLPFCAKLGGCL